MYVPKFWKAAGQESTLKVILDQALNSECYANEHKATHQVSFFALSSKLQILPSLILSPLLSVCRSTCRGQSTFDSPEISTKKPTVIWMRVVYKNLLEPATWKHFLLVMYFTDEAHEGLLRSMDSIAEIAI